MPELPEVEIVAKQLQLPLQDQPVLTEISFSRKDLRDPMPIRQLQKLKGQKILKVHRRAKYILFDFENGGIISHLGMTGVWTVLSDSALSDPKKSKISPSPLQTLNKKNHEHISLQFSNGVQLIYRDPRRFGIFEDYNPKQPEKSKRLSHLGVEPLEKEWTADYLLQNLRDKKSPIKAALMDQRLVVGLGNIYVAEALFSAGVRPQKLSRKIKMLECELLVRYSREILQDSIAKGGSSISDFKSTAGVIGHYQDHHRVYGRENQACVVCSTRLKKLTQSGRSTVYCPHCQK